MRRPGVLRPAGALVLLACGCLSDPGPTGSASDAEEAWMDTAEVQVLEDGCVGQASVKLVDLPSGHFEVMDVESYDPDANACAGSGTLALGAGSEQAISLKGDRR
jgi:hypothetical protein